MSASVSPLLPAMSNDSLLHFRWTRLSEDSVSDNSVWQTSSVLTNDDRQRAGEFTRPQDQVQVLASRILLRRTLSEVLGGEPSQWRFVRTEHGKPELDPAHRRRAFFNLTHTANFIAVAVSTVGAVGLDAEAENRSGDIVKIARRRFSPDEVLALEPLAEEKQRQHALLLWTLKESWLKALGCGLTGSLRSSRFRILQEPAEDFQEGLVEARLQGEQAARFLVGRPGGSWKASICCLCGNEVPLVLDAREVVNPACSDSFSKSFRAES